MFIPNVRCSYKRRVKLDLYGAAVYGPRTPALCGIVRLEEQSDPSSVRADSSASRGSVKEEITQSRLLFPVSVKLKQGDIVEIGDFVLVVQSVWPRYSVSGRLDHWQLDLQIKVT